MNPGAPQDAQAQDPSAMSPTIGPESILAILAALSMGGQMNPQQAQEGSAVGQGSPQSIVPQLMQSMTAGKANPAQQAQPAQPTSPSTASAATPKAQGGPQEPVALSVLRMLGMVR